MKHVSRTCNILMAGAVLVTAACAFLLSSCASSPTPQQQAGLTVLVDASVAIAVQNGSNDPAVWSDRASKIVSVGTQLKAIDSGNFVNIASTVRAVTPLLDAAHLSPGERLAANALVTTLAQMVNQNVKPNDPRIVSSMQVIDAVIVAASVYVLPAS